MDRKVTVTGFLAAATMVAISAGAWAQLPTNWVTTIDSARYGSSGTITFNDWGYVGPNGANAGTFAVTSPVTGITGFDPTRIGQRQNVLTLDPDWKSPDPAITTIMTEFNPVTRTNSSQDAQVNFYRWTYTTVGGSTFNNMQIDKAGNYFVAQHDMAFKFYDVYQYHDVTGVNPDATADSFINFQPYAISNARGWCGSTLIPDPNAVAIMAGQVKFDFVFDTYMADGGPSTAGGGSQIVPGFVMRSYGSYVVNVAQAGADPQYFTGSAVMNNNNPELNPLDAGGQVTGAALDPAYQNRVSFLGAGVVPKGVWVTGSSYVSPGVRKLNPDGTWDVQVLDIADPLCNPASPGAAPVAGAVCYQNSFAGYAFLMRADGQRTLTYVNPTGHSDYICPCWTETEFSRITTSGGALSCSSTATTASIRDSSPVQYAITDTSSSLPSCRFADTTTSPVTSRRLSGISSDGAQACYRQVRQACTSLGL
jgi:hypothetical protein